jgi:hypothetical protein
VRRVHLPEQRYEEAAPRRFASRKQSVGKDRDGSRVSSNLYRPPLISVGGSATGRGCERRSNLG